MSLKKLISDPNATCQQILDATRDGYDLFDAAARVFDDVESASEAASQAAADHEASLMRLRAADSSDFAGRHAEETAAYERAAAAVAATKAAWERYRPWKEALDYLEAGLRIADIIESN